MTYWLGIEELIEGCMPKFACPTDACFDLVSAQDLILKEGRVHKVPTGIRMDIPKGFEVQIRPRSGMALKHGVTVLNSPGTIDHGFEDQVMVMLIKLAVGTEDSTSIAGETYFSTTYSIKKGDRIAQACLKPVYETVLEKVPQIRFKGRGGLGHTGK